MKTILFSLFVLGAVNAMASEKPLTLDCDIHYSTWKSMNDPIGAGTYEKLPVQAILKPSPTNSRYELSVQQATMDGRYTIETSAIQPLPGDVLKSKSVQIYIDDAQSKLNFQNSGIEFANELVTWNMDAKNPDRPGSQLHVSCKLR